MRRHPLLVALASSLIIGVTYLVNRTVWLQGVYIATVRDMYYGCMEESEMDYVYRMRTGTCRFRNLEYDSSMQHDSDGFRALSPSRAETPGRPAHAPRIVVLGDSHAYGHGVNDDQTLAAHLSRHLDEDVRNLALPATATRRELAALAAHGQAAEFVLLQYCDNDYGENQASLQMSFPQFREAVRTRMREVIRSYEYTKQQSLPTRALMTIYYGVSDLIRTRIWGLTSVDGSDETLVAEADAFAGVIETELPLLNGKTVVVFESSGWGRNRRGFQSVFRQRLALFPQVNWIVLDSTALLGREDYFLLDDHLNAGGHRKLAAALAGVLRTSLGRHEDRVDSAEQTATGRHRDTNGVSAVGADGRVSIRASTR